RRALLLLRCLPPARHAALQHLRGLFDEHVCAHLLHREPPGTPHPPPPPPGSLPSVSSLEDSIGEVRKVLGDLIRANPSAWAPAVSAWATELLGQLSSKYAGRHGVPPGASDLNELLQLWMSCAATRCLLDIYTQCLASMSSSCPDSCVDALLDTSVQHSPHFDWVVAHIGSSFPNTIINRVLSCGLKDFCTHGASQSGELWFPSPSPDKRVPKIASVVGILGHLASRHSANIKQELLKLFHDSLGPTREQHQKAAVPFLLQLALMSPPLLATVSPDLVRSLSPQVLNQLHHHFSTFPREELDNMVTVVVHLICQTSAGAFSLLQFLLDTAMPATVITSPGPSPSDGVRDACDRLLLLLLLHLQKLVFNRPSPTLGEPSSSSSSSSPRPIPFLDALKPHIRELCVGTLKLERKRFLWQHQLLGLVAVYGAPHSAAEAMGHLLTLAHGLEELALAPQLYAVLSSCLAELLPATVQLLVRHIHAGCLPEHHLAQLCHNLATLAQACEGLDATIPTSMAAQLCPALAQHLPDFAQLLLHRDATVAEAACQLLASCPLPGAIPPAHLMAAIRAAVHQFFLTLRRAWGDPNCFGGAPGLCHSSRLLSRLSAVSAAATKAVLQQLVEGALRGANAELFGATDPCGKQEEEEEEGGRRKEASLLDINRRFTAAVDFSGGVWSVFHAGVIGRGLKATKRNTPRAPEQVAHNTQTFLNLLLRCCRASSSSPSSSSSSSINPEAAKAVAAALVEAVCPEAAGAELLWPPEEQSRGTVERDLRICHRFRAQPLLFPLLHFIAKGPPALCYCSVLLRGLLATLLGHWEGSRESGTTGSAWHLAASCSLVAIMAEGSLLPPALGNVHELFPHVAPFEVHLLLLSVWDYLRDNHP
ncbi:Integrator complex subunit 5, partial [Colius striatus]